MSGTKPTPSSAKCNSSSCAKPQASGALACAQRQARGARRTIHKRAGRSGLFDRSDANFRQEGTSLSSLPGTPPLLGACVSGIPALTSRCLLVGTHQSKATCCTGQSLSGTKFHTGGSCAHLPPSHQGSLFDRQLCTRQNSTCDVNGSRAATPRSGRISGANPILTPLIR